MKPTTLLLCALGLFAGIMLTSFSSQQRYSYFVTLRTGDLSAQINEYAALGYRLHIITSDQLIFERTIP
jgi:hypothetical protein